MESTTDGRVRHLRAAPLLAGLLAIALAAVAVLVVRHRREQPPPAPQAVRLALSVPAGVELGAGDDTLDAAIAPDGRSIVFVATANGSSQLWLRRLDAANARPLRGTEGARLPAWKPSGRAIAFLTGSRLKQIAPADAIVRDLADVPDTLGVSWRTDGSLLLGSGRGSIRQLRDGRLSEVTALSPGDRYHAFPFALPASSRFLYVAVREDGRRLIRLGGQSGRAPGATPDLPETSAHAEVADGHLLYVRDGVLLAQPFDTAAGTVGGRSVALASPVGVSATGHGYFAVSPRLLLTAPAAARRRELAWYDVTGRRTGAVGEPGDYWQVRLSPDDSDAAVTTLDPLLRTLDVIVMPTSARGAPEPLSLALSADSDPVWSGDGTRVLFRSLQDGVANLFTRRAHQPTAPDEPLLRSELDETASDWRDSTVLFQAPGKGTGLDVWAFDANTREVTGVATSAFNESDARWSPDGALLAYVSDESGRPDIYVTAAPDAAAPSGQFAADGRVRVSFGGGTRPRWSRDGRALFFMRDDRIMRAEMTVQGFVTPVAVMAAEGVRDFAVARRSDRILAVSPVQRSAPADASAVVDWLSTLTATSETRPTTTEP